MDGSEIASTDRWKGTLGSLDGRKLDVHLAWNRRQNLDVLPELPLACRRTIDTPPVTVRSAANPHDDRALVRHHTARVHPDEELVAVCSFADVVGEAVLGNFKVLAVVVG